MGLLDPSPGHPQCPCWEGGVQQGLESRECVSERVAYLRQHPPGPSGVQVGQLHRVGPLLGPLIAPHPPPAPLRNPAASKRAGLQASHSDSRLCAYCCPVHPAHWSCTACPTVGQGADRPIAAQSTRAACKPSLSASGRLSSVEARSARVAESREQIAGHPQHSPARVHRSGAPPQQRQQRAAAQLRLSCQADHQGVRPLRLCCHP